ncbi:hypothetical protein JAB9_54220 [Janthinobacterium sp. HH107]|uniref:DUF6988 family protein n=1 Tax=Janthinobacterium sp. HH107 TaxID=1537279 RepID=UPI0008745FA5|nr:hypothetical protein [Janthinobacterium sp. HH107]OEZ90101.1 hypothetical protein JAB9_54220 [Janthinobacterium sp. HH107]
MTKLIDALIVELQDGVTWIDKLFVNIGIPSEEEVIQVAAGCFDIAIELQSGILLLCRARSFALVFAAQRLIFEAVIRGLFIQYCIDERKFHSFKNGGTLGKYESMIVEIEKKLGDEVLDFEKFRARLEGSMHHFTHTGYQHVARRYATGILGPNYSERDICTAINLTALFGFQAAARMAIIANRPELALATKEKMVAYSSRYMVLKKQFPQNPDRENK